MSSYSSGPQPFLQHGPLYIRQYFHGPTFDNYNKRKTVLAQKKEDVFITNGKRQGETELMIKTIKKPPIKNLKTTNFTPKSQLKRLTVHGPGAGGRWPIVTGFILKPALDNH